MAWKGITLMCRNKTQQWERETPEWAKYLLWFQAETLYKIGVIMALVSIEQSDLDDIATTVSDVADALQAVIDNPNPLAPADESALKSAVVKLQGVGPKTAPVEPPVEPPVV